MSKAYLPKETWVTCTFQRMTQEPKSQQQNQGEIYQLVSLNHTFLSALASTSTFIQNHPTTEASESFSLAARNISDNLNQCIALLTPQEKEIEKKAELSSFLENVDTKTMLSMHDNPTKIIAESVNSRMNEAYLIIEQLKWLYSLSDQMLRLILSFNSFVLLDSILKSVLPYSNSSIGQIGIGLSFVP